MIDPFILGHIIRAIIMLIALIWATWPMVEYVQDMLDDAG